MSQRYPTSLVAAYDQRVHHCRRCRGLSRAALPTNDRSIYHLWFECLVALVLESVLHTYNAVYICVRLHDDG